MILQKFKITTVFLCGGEWHVEDSDLSWRAGIDLEGGFSPNRRASLLEGLILHGIQREFVIVKDTDGSLYSVAGYIQYGIA